MLNCRGKETRIKLVNNYDIEPVAKFKLLNGQKKKSNAGNDITNIYYLFKHTKNNTDKVGYIYCGEEVAKHFSELTNRPLPALFNILVGDAEERNINIDTTIHKPRVSSWNKERKQLYNAVMILFLYLDVKPNTPLFDIKEKLENYPGQQPYLSFIKSVNTIIKKLEKTIDEILDELKNDNNIREFDFSLLSRRLQDESIVEYFTGKFEDK